MGFFQNLPIVAKAGSIVQLALKADRPPIGSLRCQSDRCGFFHFIVFGLQRGNDGAHLRGMDRPHACIAQLGTRALCRSLHGCTVFEFRHHTVAGHFAISMTSRCNFQFGAQHQGMGKLASHAHGAIRDRAVMAADEIHQAKANRLQARVCRNRKCVFHAQ